MTTIFAGDSEDDAWRTTAVYFNGEYLHGCIAASDTEGWALISKGTVTNGTWFPDTCTCSVCGDGHTPQVRLEGNVEFRPL